MTFTPGLDHFFLEGALSLLQRLPLQPHREQPHADLWPRAHERHGLVDRRTQFHLQRNKVPAPVPPQAVRPSGESWSLSSPSRPQWLTNFLLPPAGGADRRVHRQRHRRVQQRRAGRRRCPVFQLGQQLHLPVDCHPGWWAGLPHGHLLPVRQPGRHLHRCDLHSNFGLQNSAVSGRWQRQQVFTPPPSAGATVEAALDGVEAAPDLFPASSIDLPDINFFYRFGSQINRRPDWARGTETHTDLTVKPFRSRKATASCEQGRSSVISVRCNLEKSERGELAVPR